MHAGYTHLEQIHESKKSRIYRGVREADGLAVIIKASREYPSRKDAAVFRHEYEITKNLAKDGIVKVLGMEEYPGGIALIEEEFGGVSLREHSAQGRVTPADVLAIGVRVAAILGELHSQDIIHKNVTPDSILINPETLQVKLTDFSIAQNIITLTEKAISPDAMEGALPYMSPEQTGRMNRTVDHRSDFYSLGITLYEALAGRLPFTQTDPMELVYCHIAKTPAALHEQNPAIPPVVGHIVMKLLEKNAENRYQSAFGLQADLERCLTILNGRGTLSEFAIGEKDVSEILYMPQKMVGRQAEIARLKEAYDRIALGGKEAVFISGYAGMGKTALVRELYPSCMAKGAFFIEGKFEQSKQDIPYSGFIQTLQGLVRQVLLESGAALETWKKRILKVLGANARLIIESVAELELITGAQPEVAELGVIEAGNRFNKVLIDFIQVFARREHPLVIFLDDLQHADTASLNLLTTVITDPETTHLLFIGAYRAGETGKYSPLLTATSGIQQAGIPMTAIYLEPLDISHSLGLTAEMLGSRMAGLQPLAEAVLSKTGGNPFFMIEFIQKIRQDGLLHFDHAHGAWAWDLEGIDRLGMTDNLLDFLVTKIRRLYGQAQEMLRLASCIGSVFDLKTLAAVAGRSLDETADSLWESVREGLLLPLGDAYRLRGAYEGQDVRFQFLHDRVQEASHALYAAGEALDVHLRIGRFMLAATPPEQLGEKIYGIVAHINKGLDFITKAEERLDVSRLNLRAGRLAKISIAMEQASSFLDTGIKALPENAWKEHHGLAFSLYREWAESEFLCGRRDHAEDLFTYILEHAAGNLERIEICLNRTIMYSYALRAVDALTAGREGLKLLGFETPPPDDPVAIGNAFREEMAAYQTNTQGLHIPNLVNLPEIRDPEIRTCMNLILYMTQPAFRGNTAYLLIIILKAMNLTLKRGISPESICVFAGMGALKILLGEIDAGYELAVASQKLSERFDNPSMRSISQYFSGNFILHWKRHISQAIDILRNSHRFSMATGNYYFAGQAVQAIMRLGLSYGHDPLEDLLVEINGTLMFYQKTKNDMLYKLVDLYKHMALNLLGRTYGPTSLSDETLNEADFLAYAMARRDNILTGLFYLYKLEILYLHGEYAEALAMAEAAEPYAESFITTMLSPELVFYSALCLAAVCPSAPRDKQKAYRETLSAHLARMQKWKEHGPENFAGRLLLMKAEEAALGGDALETITLYDQAVEEFERQGFLSLTALAGECAGRYHLAHGRQKIGASYLLDALKAYSEWGAAGMVHELRRRYADSLARTTPAPDYKLFPGAPEAGGAVPEQSVRHDAIDLISALKASQAISSEIVLDTLIGKLMKIVVENAGATNGALLIERDGTFVIAAQSILEKDVVTTLTHEPFAASRQTPQSVINYVLRTREAVVLSDAAFEGNFMADPYIAARASRSILCLPILEQARPIGVIYLENTKVKGAFTPERIATLQLLASQAAISLKNALTFDELTQTRQILKESEENYRNLFENMQDAFIRCDLNGKIVLLSPSAEKITGYTIPERLGKDITELLSAPPSNRKAFIKEFLAHEYGENFETQIKHKDGHVLWVSINYHQYRDRRGNLLGIEGIVRNITERKLAEEEKKILERQLIQSQKMESIGTLAGGIAHDFNNILASVIGFADLAKSKLQRGMNIEKELEGVFVAGLRARDLVKQILTFSRKTNIQHIPLNLLPLIKESVKFIRASLPTTIEIRQDFHVSNDIVLGDPTQIHQVFMNLCANAAYAMKEGGGALGISLKELEMTGKTFPDGKAYLKAMPPGRYLQLSITDTGCGMPQEMLDKIFNPFFTTKPHGEGTGLGLSVVHGIIQNMGGHITVYSEPGRGTTFHIFMPALTEDTMDAGRKTQGGDMPRGQGTILFVDDEPGIIESGQGILEELGYQVISFTDPVRALSTFKQTPRIYDAVLTDMTMPGMTGLELSKCVTELRPNLPVLLHTGLGAGVTEEALKQSGVSKMIMKPMIAKELAEVLYHLLHPHLPKGES